MRKINLLILLSHGIHHNTNVLVKIDKFIFLVDFVILDMDEDVEVPLILGQPFLATTRVIISRLVLRVRE